MHIKIARVDEALLNHITVWGSTHKTKLNNVIMLQKKIMRITSKASYDVHTNILFKEQHNLKFNDIYLSQAAKFMFLFKKGLLPNTFRDMFALTNRINPYIEYEKFKLLLYLSI